MSEKKNSPACDGYRQHIHGLSEQIEKLGGQVPERSKDQTWRVNACVLEQALGVPRDSDEACIAVLDHEGKMVGRVHGPLTEQRLNTIVEAYKNLN